MSLRILLLGLIFLPLCGLTQIHGQNFERKDSLKGSITEERAWWNLLHYTLEVDVDVNNRFLSGSNTIRYEVLSASQVIQIDLQSPMIVEKVVQQGKELNYTQEGNAYFIELDKKQVRGKTRELKVYFKGRPVESENPPWDGGFVWTEDRSGKPFVANAVQDIGPSSWFPCKDHPYDEPDEGVDLIYRVPRELTAVGNGRLVKEQEDGGKMRYHWRVTLPINAYGINLSIANYSHFGETYQGEQGPLDCDYYVLPANLEKAKEQFKQVPKMLEAFEHWFGPYPFYQDSFKIVEVPYLGMEHQSAVTYGNEYENGYRGGDVSFTGWGLEFDFIIIHESGHEWFANSITNNDVADMWIHEGFTNYSEVLYLDYHFGTKAGNEYLQGIRENVRNDQPVIGRYHVDQRGSTDMYAKGAATIHTLRQLIDDDEAFRELLRGMNREFYHQTVSSTRIESYIAEETGLDLKGFFDQYLRSIRIPLLRYKIKGNTLSFRYKNTVEGFVMPLKVKINGKEKWIEPGADWKELQLEEPIEEFVVDPNFYIYTAN